MEFPLRRRASGRSPPEKIAEILREAERVLDRQLHALEELDDKIEQMLTISLGALLSGFGLGAFMVGRANGWGWFVIALAAGLFWNLISLGHLAWGYGVLDREVEANAGPAIGWLVAESDSPGKPLEEHLRYVLGSIENSFNLNDGAALFASMQRRKGVRWLFASVSVYIGTAIAFLSVTEIRGATS